MTASNTIRAEDIQGWMFPEELDWLRVQAARFQTIAEIGSWKGRSTHALLSSCPGVVYAIDHFQGSPDEPAHVEARDGSVKAEFFRNVGHFPGLRVVEGDSLTAAEQFKPASLDMVFVDASHVYGDVLADICAWLPKTRHVIAGHDFAPGDWPGVVRAVVEVFGGRVQRAAQSIWYVEVDR